MRIKLKHESEYAGEVFEIECVSGKPEKIIKFPESIQKHLNNRLNFINIGMKNLHDAEGFPDRNSEEIIFSAFFWSKKPLLDGRLFIMNEFNTEGIEYKGGLYYGQSENGVPEGCGLLVYNDHQIESCFSRGMPVGKGKILGYKEIDGTKVSGEIYDNKLNGKAEIIFNKTEKYVGDVLDNLIHGEGIYYYSDRSVYKGEFKHNLKHGQGVYTRYDGTEFSGQWEDDEIIS